jgi:hypothetical protein
MIDYPELSNEHCLLSYDASVPCIVIEWRGYQTSRQFRDISDAALKLLAQHGVSKVLNDTTMLPIIGGDDQRWTQDDFLPRAIRAGFRFCAMVNSRFYFNRVAVNNVAQTINPHEMIVEYFENADRARTWLRGLKAQHAEGGVSG